MRIAVVAFPGSGGAEDAAYAYGNVLKQDVYTVWHLEEDLQKPDLVVVPGGASFGDYLRPGALAKGSPVCGPLRKFALDGGPMIGIGNGFQILTEIEVLPGILLLNNNAKFLNEDVNVIVQEGIECPFLKHLAPETILKLPLACSYGRFYADRRTLQDIEDDAHVPFRYCDRYGDLDVDDPDSPIMSTHAIAAVTSRHHNVLGLMLHPERAVEDVMGNSAGLEILKPILGIEEPESEPAPVESDAAQPEVEVPDAQSSEKKEVS